MKKILKFLKKLSLDIALPLPFGIPVSIPLSIPLKFLEKLSFKWPFFSHKPQKKRESLILDFWQAIEYFSLQKIPDVTPPRKGQDKPPNHSNTLSPWDQNQSPSLTQVFPYYPNNPLPWDQNHWMFQAPKKENSFLRFQIFGGTYPVRRIHQILEDKCGKDEDIDEDVAVSETLLEGDTCVYSFCITDEGRPLFDSFMLPTCAWALGRTLTPGPHDPAWLKGFDDFETQIKQDFMKHFAIEDDDAVGQGLKEFNVGRIIKSDHLLAYTTEIIADLGLEELLRSPKIRMESFYVKQQPKTPEKGRYQVSDKYFLNSFFVDDLGKISKEVNGRKCGLGLKKFLSHDKDVAIKKRIDLRQNRHQILERLAPSKFPSGCWPTKGHHPLATSQQFAINSVISDLTHEAGMLAVNGPPGTGKTTLLRDLISAVVVERAKRLSRLKKPSDAFVKIEDAWKGNQYQRKIAFWKDDFKGFEVVVASSNNGALDNITLEIPGRNAIDSSWEPEVDYFSDISSSVLGKPAWALRSASLGSKGNCWNFLQPFWYGKTSETLPVSPSGLSEPFHANRGYSPSPGAIFPSEQKTSFQVLLQSLHKEHIDWKDALNRFNNALAEEGKKREEAEKIYALFHQAALYQDHPKWLPNFLVKWQAFSLFFNRLKNRSTQKNLEKLQEQLSQKIDTVSLLNWLNNEETRELSIPWLTPDWFQARARVFVEALRLHKAFITANAKIIENNLRGAIDILQGNIPYDTNPAAISAAWSTLFFVVPVISTTFASFSRLFSHIGQEGLGWVLIDEAGQALPQAAAGAIWRAKRTVVVGDPMQLKPVITLSLPAQIALQHHFKTETTWIPGRTSVQQLADRISPQGTYITAGEQSQWVGMPLRVHRRCEELEFKLSNAIAYGGLMFFGTSERPPFRFPPSQWIHIATSSPIDSHWVPEEGGFVHDLLSRLLKEGIHRNSIFVISPFRTVVKHLREQLKKTHNGVNIGTIHTTQGKEADVIILVLGGNPQKPGAKKWVSQEPNLLNVAATRAKRRFYIVGNEKDWSCYPYFREASALFKEFRGSAAEGEEYFEQKVLPLDLKAG